MKKLLTVICASAALAVQAAGYHVIATLPDDTDGAMAYICDYDSNPIDSAYVSGCKAVFDGHIEIPDGVMITVDGNALASFFLENDTISVVSTKTEVYGGVRTDWHAEGGKLNTICNEYRKKSNDIYERWNDSDSDAASDSLRAARVALIEEYLYGNADNAFGASMAMGYLKDPLPFLEEHSALLEIPSVKYKIASIKRKESLVPGAPFVDFAVTTDDGVHSLSDVVGKGNYVLLDFWASWCEPCMMSMEHLKKLHEDYGGRNFKILGVSIKDDPNNTKMRIEEFELPWEIWATVNSKPAIDAYAIESIPYMVLFAPDGTIVANNISVDDLNAKLKEIFAD